MKTTSLLSYGERRRIYRTQADLGIPANRLAHVRQVGTNHLKLAQGKNGAFYAALLPENRQYEDRKPYLQRINWLQQYLAALDHGAQTALEAGVRLHDIGYAVDSGGSHPEAGYQMLQGESGLKLWAQLSLSSSTDREMISQIVRHHGIFTDIGFLYQSEALKTFDQREQIVLMLMSALDSTAKPKGNKFHSMLFSRQLIRYQHFLEDGAVLTGADKIQQLFGPINFCWLTEGNQTLLDKALDKDGTKDQNGFAVVLDRTYFHCWPLLKDLVTPEVSFAATYHTPFNPAYASHFARFLTVISQVVERFADSPTIIIDTDFNYYDFEARPPFLSRLRKALTSPDAELIEQSKDTLTYQGLIFKITQQPESTKILIGF